MTTPAANPTDEANAKRADKWARIVAVVVAIIGLIVVVGPVVIHPKELGTNPFKPRSTTETTIVTTGTRGDRPQVTTTAVRPTTAKRRRGPHQHGLTRVTVRHGTRTVTTSVTKPRDESVLERTLSTGGLLLFRLGIVAAAAFLAGFVVQRTMMAQFAVKLGPLELPAITKAAAAASAEALAAVQKSTDKQIHEVQAGLRKLRRDERAERKKMTRGTQAVLDEMYERLRKLEKPPGKL